MTAITICPNLLSGWLQEAYDWLDHKMLESRWKLRRVIRVMNQVLASLGLEQHPDKTFIGRLERGFDFLGIQFTATGETSPSAVSLARRKEKTARLYEQGASTPTTTFVEVNQRIERHQQNWLRYLQGILGIDHPATKNHEPSRHPQRYHARPCFVFSSSLSPSVTIAGRKSTT